MRDAQILKYLQSTVWLMEGGLFTRMLAVLDRHVRGERLAGDRIAEIVAEREASKESKRYSRSWLSLGDPDDDAPYAVAGNVAVIPVDGLIVKYASCVNGTSQPEGTSAQAVVSALGEARRDSRVKGVTLDIDSGGGEMAGLDDVVEAIDLTQDLMPVAAYCHDWCGSAAYWIAAACRAGVYANPIGMVGSIGALVAVEDSSEYSKEIGFKTVVVRSAPRKGLIVDGAPIGNAAIEQLQEMVDTAGNQFIDHVASRRGLARAKVEAVATGDMFSAAAAKKAGLIDDVCGFEAFVSGFDAELRGMGGVGTSRRNRA